MSEKPGTTGLTFNEKLSQNNQSGVNQMKYSVIVPGAKLPTQGGLNFSNQKQDMSKSVIQREASQDIEAFIRDTKMKFLKMQQVISQHDTIIKDLRSGKDSKSFPSYTLSTSNNSDSFTAGLANDLRNDFDNNFSKLRTTIYQQIDRVRLQINDSFARRNDLDFALSKFDSKIIETVKSSKEILQLKQKINFECRTVFERIVQDFSPKISNLNDQIRSKNNQTQQQISQLRKRIDTLNQQTKPTVFTSNQKFYSPRLIKYKQVIQKLPNNSYDKPGPQITINEVIYYLDKEGRLLDSSQNYLVDKNNKEIQLDYKQLSILNIHDMLT